MKSAEYRRLQARNILDMHLSSAIRKVQRQPAKRSARQLSFDEAKRRLLARRPA